MFLRASTLQGPLRQHLTPQSSTYRNLRSQSSSFTEDPAPRKPRSQVTAPRSPYHEEVELLSLPTPQHQATICPPFPHSWPPDRSPVGSSASEWGGAPAVPIFGLHSLQDRCTPGEVSDAELFGQVNNLSSGTQGPSLTKQSSVCAIGDRIFQERPQHCCEAEEKLILSLESVPAWGEDTNTWKGWSLGL